jgi:hypothetical protein
MKIHFPLFVACFALGVSRVGAEEALKTSNLRAVSVSVEEAKLAGEDTIRVIKSTAVREFDKAKTKFAVTTRSNIFPIPILSSTGCAKNRPKSMSRTQTWAWRSGST